MVCRRYAAAVFLLASAAHGAVQRAADPDEGGRLASVWCSNCHWTRPDPHPSAVDAIPSFAAIAARPSMTPTAIAAFLRAPHRNMPDFGLSEQQIRDLGAYILSLRDRPQ